MWGYKRKINMYFVVFNMVEKQTSQIMSKINKQEKGTGVVCGRNRKAVETQLERRGRLLSNEAHSCIITVYGQICLYMKLQFTHCIINYLLYFLHPTLPSILNNQIENFQTYFHIQVFIAILLIILNNNYDCGKITDKLSATER